MKIYAIACTTLLASCFPPKVGTTKPEKPKVEEPTVLAPEEPKLEGPGVPKPEDPQPEEPPDIQVEEILPRVSEIEKVYNFRSIQSLCNPLVSHYCILKEGQLVTFKSGEVFLFLSVFSKAQFSVEGWHTTTVIFTPSGNKRAEEAFPITAPDGASYQFIFDFETEKATIINVTEKWERNLMVKKGFTNEVDFSGMKIVIKD